jgi:hypothetical protein
MTAQLVQQHPQRGDRLPDVLGVRGEPRQIMTETGPVEAPAGETFHEFGKQFAPGLIPLALPGERRRANTELPRNE